LRGVSKDGPVALVAHPSRLAVKNGEHLRMTVELSGFRVRAKRVSRNDELEKIQFLGMSAVENSGVFDRQK
jgi:hypothetical protein